MGHHLEKYKNRSTSHTIFKNKLPMNRVFKCEKIIQVLEDSVDESLWNVGSEKDFQTDSKSSYN